MLIGNIQNGDCDMTVDPRVQVAERIAELWNEAGITYAVAHGIEHYPKRLGRDLDVVIPPKDLELAISIATDSLQASGLKVVVPSSLPWGRGVFAFGKEFGIELHLIELPLRVGPVTLAERLRPWSRVGPFSEDRWISFAKQIIMPVFARTFPKRGQWELFEEEAIYANCRELFGQYVTAQLMMHLRGGDADGLKYLAAKLVAIGIGRSFARAPFQALSNSLHWLARKWTYCGKRSIPVVAVIGDHSKICKALSGLTLSRFFMKHPVLMCVEDNKHSFVVSPLRRAYNNYVANTRGPLVYVLETSSSHRIVSSDFDLLIVVGAVDQGSLLQKPVVAHQKVIFLNSVDELIIRLEDEIIDCFISMHE